VSRADVASPSLRQMSLGMVLMAFDGVRPPDLISRMDLVLSS